MLIKAKNKAITLLILFFSFSSAIAQLGGSYAYSFLTLPTSARAEAMGGYIISIYDDDLAAAYQNPSLLNAEMDNQILLDFNNYFANIRYGYAGFAKSFDKIGNFHIGAQYMNYGKFVYTNVQGNVLGTFNANDIALTVGYSRPFFKKLLWLGINTKLIFSQFHIYNSFGMAADFGITYLSKNKHTTVSAVARNMGGQLVGYDGSNNEPIPFEVHLGISQTFKHVPLRLFMWVTNLQMPDLSYYDPQERFVADPLTGDTTDTRIGIGENILRHFVIGAELYPFREHLFLRIAYNFKRGGEMDVGVKRGAVGLCYGIGIKISGLTFSYSRAHYHLAGSPNHISLNIDLNHFFRYSRKKAAPSGPKY